MLALTHLVLKELLGCVLRTQSGQAYHVCCQLLLRILYLGFSWQWLSVWSVDIQSCAAALRATVWQATASAGMGTIVKARGHCLQ